MHDQILMRCYIIMIIMLHNLLDLWLCSLEKSSGLGCSANKEFVKTERA